MRGDVRNRGGEDAAFDLVEGASGRGMVVGVVSFGTREGNREKVIWKGPDPRKEGFASHCCDVKTEGIDVS